MWSKGARCEWPFSERLVDEDALAAVTPSAKPAAMATAAANWARRENFTVLHPS
jgi:hypothetical protein